MLQCLPVRQTGENKKTSPYIREQIAHYLKLYAYILFKPGKTGFQNKSTFLHYITVHTGSHYMHIFQNK